MRKIIPEVIDEVRRVAAEELQHLEEAQRRQNGKNWMVVMQLATVVVHTSIYIKKSRCRFLKNEGRTYLLLGYVYTHEPTTAYHSQANGMVERFTDNSRHL